jgi:hypothetical protein
MKASTIIVAFVFTLTTTVAIFFLARMNSKNSSVGSYSVSETSDYNTSGKTRILSDVSSSNFLSKAQIMSLVTGASPISAEMRDKLFASLSGPNMLRYNFTQAEKILIVKALNALSREKRPAKESSSARTEITQFSAVSVFQSKGMDFSFSPFFGSIIILS